MPDRDRGRALLRAVELYYHEGLTQAAIADRLGCTRWTVGRLLKEAADIGIVKIEIDHPFARRRDLETGLNAAYGFTHSQVVPTQDSPVATLTLVARMAAEFLADLRPRPHVFGISCGRTTAAIARAIPDRWASGISVLQTNAAANQADDSLVGDSVGLLALRGQGTGRLLPTGPIARTLAEAQRIRKETGIAGLLTAASRADVVVYSPGTTSADTLIVRSGHLPAEHVERLRQAGAVGTVLNRYVDATGAVVDADLDGRTVGLGLSELRQAKNYVAVGCGESKWEAFGAVASGGLANVLLVDSETAEFLLERAA